MDFWHAIETEIFKNDSLDIYEKMCLLVLMSQGDEVHLTSVQLASYMGCGLNTAKRAFESLRIKGYLAKDYQASPATVRDSNVVKNEEAVGISKPLKEESEDFQAGFFTGTIESKSTTQQTESFETRLSEKDKDIDPEISRRRQMAAYL